MSLYSIKTTSQMTGVTRNTLLAWERRYQLVTPIRTEQGYRLYSATEISTIQAVKTLVDQGHSISEAIRLHRQRHSPPISLQSAGLNEVAKRLFQALANYDQNNANTILATVAGLPWSTVLEELYIPVLHLLSENYAAGKISIAQEHFISEFCRSQLILMLQKLGSNSRFGPSLIVASYPTELHDIGVLIFAIQMAINGCKIYWLGARTPLDSLIECAKAIAPRAICVSVISPIQQDELSIFSQQLRSQAPESILIFIGGQGLPHPTPEVQGIHFANNHHQILNTMQENS